MRRFVAVLALICCPVGAQDSNSTGIAMIAHHVTWHVKVDGQNTILADGITVPCRSTLNPTGIPCTAGSTPPGNPELIGYDALDPVIIDAQNTEYKTNGISPLSSWWGMAGTLNERSGDLFLDAYLAVPSTVRTAILYEVVGLLQTGPTAPDGGDTYPFDSTAVGKENHRRFVEHLAHLNGKYFSKYPDRFLRIDGRPVVYIWLSSRFRGDFASASAEATSKSPAYIVCSEVNAYGPGAREKPQRPGLVETVEGCDAISAYGNYSPPLTIRYGGLLTTEYTAQYITGIQRWSQWLNSEFPEKRVIVPVQFAYHDHRGNPPLTSSPEQARTLALAARTLLEASARRCGNLSWMVLVDSFNEHYEGSSVEPTYRYGTGYLDILRDVFAHAGPAPGTCR